MMSASTPTKPSISVNGLVITASQIDAEVQYHPAEKLEDAHEMAMRALVVRELLLQEAQRKGLFEDRCSVKDEQAAIDALLKNEIRVPEPDFESCKRYYNNHQQKFVTSPLFQVSHILFPTNAQRKAEAVLTLVQENPSRFSDLAKEHSVCSSAREGGAIGQISKGQTTPEFEAALLKMEKGETSRTLVTTRYGCHIIRVHEREESKEIPFEAVHEWIADYLKQSVWQRAVSQYIAILAGKSDIKGFTLKAAETPLVQ